MKDDQKVEETYSRDGGKLITINQELVDTSLTISDDRIVEETPTKLNEKPPQECHKPSLRVSLKKINLNPFLTIPYTFFLDRSKKSRKQARILARNDSDLS